MDTTAPPATPRRKAPPFNDELAPDASPMQTWATFRFAQHDSIRYEVDHDTGALTIDVAMVPVRELPRAASGALSDWLHEHLSAATALTLEAELQQFAHQRVKLHALFAALSNCAATLPVPEPGQP